MAVTVTELRNEIDQADSATGWTNITTTGTTDPVPIEATGWLGANVGAEIFVGYHTITATDLSDAVIYCWVFSRLSLGDTLDTNGGLMVMAADATPDRIGYKVNGADSAAFRHDDGPTGWQCPALDTTSLPAFYVSAGAEANLDWTNIVEVGTIVNSLVAAPGMNPTYNVDIMRWLDPTANNGCALDIIGGTSGTPGLFSEIATADRQTGNQQAHGIVRQLAAGAFGVQGPLRFGNATGTNSSWFEDSSVSMFFEDRGFRTDLYKIFITDNGTGTTTFRLHGCALVAPTGVGAEFDADTDTDVTDVVLDQNCRIEGFTNGVGLQAGHTCTDTTITGSGAVRANGATMNGSSVLQTTVTANNSALIWNVNTDPDGLLDDMTFDKTSGVAHHAIEFGTSIPTTSITLNGCAFGTDFSATEDGSVGDETFHFLDTTGTITLNLVGCSGNFGYRTEGVVVTIVADPATSKVTCEDQTGAMIENARVLLETADNGGGSGLPYQAEISTLTQSSGTATLTAASAHGLATNDYVVIRRAVPEGYNKQAQITVTSTTAFTYSVDSGLSSPATNLGAPDYIDAQDETDYDNTGDNGTFNAGTLHNVPDVITMDSGVTATVDAESLGGVTQFTIDNSGQTTAVAAGDTDNQSSTTGGGILFSLTPESNNLQDPTAYFSYAPISGLTDSNGVIQSSKVWPASQGLTGWARKSTTSPFYKTSPISVADASGGTDLLVLMISDE